MPDEHATPQPLQLVLVQINVQVPLQSMTLSPLLSYGPQAQVPLEQLQLPGPHAWPHEPQLAGSFCVSMHDEPHTVNSP